MEGKLHVEIGMDGRKVVSRLDGNGLELIAAALRCVNLFYTAFEKGGLGDDFKDIFLGYLNEKDSMIWRTDFEAEKKENEG
nr:MAG TPA: hypothetical protein [Caudoviricetes sp.]